MPRWYAKAASSIAVLHDAGLDRGHGAAETVDLVDQRPGAALQLVGEVSM